MPRINDDPRSPMRQFADFLNIEQVAAAQAHDIYMAAIIAREAWRTCPPNETYQDWLGKWIEAHKVMGGSPACANCGYQNIGQVCTHCGHVNPEEFLSGYVQEKPASDIEERAAIALSKIQIPFTFSPLVGITEAKENILGEAEIDFLKRESGTAGSASNSGRYNA